MFNDYPDVMTPQQVAQALDLCTASVYRMINNKELGHRRIGRKIIVPKICLIAYMKSALYTVSRL